MRRATLDRSLGCIRRCRGAAFLSYPSCDEEDVRRMGYLSTAVEGCSSVASRQSKVLVIRLSFSSFFFPIECIAGCDMFRRRKLSHLLYRDAPR